MKKKTLLSLLVCGMVGLTCLCAACNQTEQDEVTSPAETYDVQTISKEDLLSNIDTYTIVDLRQDEPYLGWPEEGMDRGGHIENAVQFSYNWLNYLEQADTTLADLMNEKGLTTDKTLVLYHNDNAITNDFAQQIMALGYENVFVFEDFAGWVADENYPLIAAPHYEMIVSPEWVHELISGNNPEGYDNDKFIVMEGSWISSDAYDERHLPGAYFFTTDNVEIADYENERTEEYMYNFLPAEEIQANLEKFGITYDTTVVLYDPFGAGSYCGRVMMALMYAGVEDVRMMNGGLPAWEALGYEVETEPCEPTPVDSFGATAPLHPEYVLSMPDEVLKEQEDPNFRLVSIRSWEEFIGETSGYSYITKKGEPAGAVWGHNIDAYFDIDGTYKCFAEIEEMLAEWDVTSENRISFYCGTGWRATIPWMLCYIQGWDVTMYDGGWYAWQLDESLPVQYGDPREQ